MGSKVKTVTQSSKETSQLILDIMGGRPKFGDLIKGLRATQDLTMEQLGALLGTSRQYINNIEKGRDTLSLSRAISIALKFGYNPKFFVEVWVDDQLARENLPQYKTKIIDQAQKKSS